MRWIPSASHSCCQRANACSVLVLSMCPGLGLGWPATSQRPEYMHKARYFARYVSSTTAGHPYSQRLNCKRNLNILSERF